MTKPAKSGIPDNVMRMLAAADARQGFPKGTMASVMQQEVGGNFDKYIADPTTYHYGLNKDGRRIAGHTGKVSTAFGPFGILESTGADPGYGVMPLKSKDLEEQVRFAAEYLGARSKKAGGLQAGLSGYGEGEKYGAQVAGRLQGWGREARGAPVQEEPAVAVASAEAVAPAPTGQSALSVPAQQMEPVQVAQPMPSGVSPWAEFLSVANAKQAAPVRPEQLAYGPSMGPMAQMNVQRPDFMSMVGASSAPRAVDFSSFGSWGRNA